MTSSKDPIHQPFSLGGHLVGGLWRYFLPPELTTLDFPQEKRADCLACPKAKYEGYRPDYKCCTYHPRVPNFSLGLACHGKNAKAIIGGLNEKGWLLPEGLVTSPELWYDYLADLEDDKFGLSKRVLCPFLKKEDGLCQIYAYRNGVCSTFFCMHDHGGHGNKFWDELQTLAVQVEMALGQWCMEELGIDIAAYIQDLNKFAKNIDDISDVQTKGWKKKYRKILWQDWFGKEEDFFVAAGELVSARREKLWEIANGIEIQEANAFDKAQAKSAPKHLRDQVDEEDYEPGETIPPRDIYKKFLKRHTKLWTVPNKPLKLSQKVLIRKNPTDSYEASQNADKAYEVAYLPSKTTQPDEEFDWQIYVDPIEAEILMSFKESKLISEKDMTAWRQQGLADPRDFVCRWVGLRALVKAKV